MSQIPDVPDTTNRNCLFSFARTDAKNQNEYLYRIQLSI
jgi:hypothetical protein